MNDQPTLHDVAHRLVVLYEQPFGGKPNGRYRISPKFLRSLMNRRRLSDDLIRQLTDEMFELGFVFINLETYYVVTSVRTFTNCRRVGDAVIKETS